MLKYFDCIAYEIQQFIISLYCNFIEIARSSETEAYTQHIIRAHNTHTHI